MASSHVMQVTFFMLIGGAHTFNHVTNKTRLSFLR